jgi:hypothetical protein
LGTIPWRYAVQRPWYVVLVVVFHDDDRAFHEWLDAYPDGYFLNVKKSGSPRGVLHQSECYHFDRGPSWRWTDTRKICSESKAELETWASTNLGEAVAYCDCL